jgi:hypothetical protein
MAKRLDTKASEGLLPIGDLSPFLIEESPKIEAEIELMKRTYSYLSNTKAGQSYQTRGNK